jgi:hypothetical protein
MGDDTRYELVDHLVDWLIDLENWRMAHRYDECDHADAESHDRGWREMMDRKAELIAACRDDLESG